MGTGGDGRTAFTAWRQFGATETCCKMVVPKEDTWTWLTSFCNEALDHTVMRLYK